MLRPLLLAALAVTTAPAQTLPAPEAILSRLRQVNDRFLLNWPEPGRDIVTDRARPDNTWTRATTSTHPRLTLRRSDGLAVVAADAEPVESLRQRVGAFALPAGGADLQRAYTLTPGAYTAEVSAEAGGAGTALIEVYVEAPDT